MTPKRTQKTTPKPIVPGYWSVTPATVRYCKALGGGDAKHLYGEISALCNKSGYCWATNKYFAELYGVDERTVRRWLTLLVENNFVTVEIYGKQRKIFLTQEFLAVAPDVAVDEPEEELPQTKKVEPKYTDVDLELAELLNSRIIYNFPDLEKKKVNIFNWAADIRKLREIDGASIEQINFMLTWIHGGTIKTKKFEAHDFWSKNILSAGKLRKQWYTLVPQLQSSVKQIVKKEAVAQL